jgi:hypothetical protein
MVKEGKGRFAGGGIDFWYKTVFGFRVTKSSSNNGSLFAIWFAKWTNAAIPEAKSVRSPPAV